MKENEINEIFRFRKYPVYEQAKELRKELKAISRKKFPKEEQHILRSQLWRALDSIILNIAEGSNRYSNKAHCNFLNYAIGSTDEVVAVLDVATDDGYIDTISQTHFIGKLGEIMKQLRALHATIRKNKEKQKT